MTQAEYIEINYKLNQRARDDKRYHDVQMELIEAKHREIIQAEQMRYKDAIRRQKAEYAIKVDEVLERIYEAKRLRALTQAEETKKQ